MTIIVINICFHNSFNKLDPHISRMKRGLQFPRVPTVKVVELWTQ